jgi:DNA primase
VGFFIGDFTVRINYGEEIRRRVSMPEICRCYGIEVNRGGFTKCPFHNEKTASMKIYDDGAHCFGCGAHFNSVIDFVMRYFSIDFLTACDKLNKDFCLGLPIGHIPTLREQREAEKMMAERKAAAEARQREREEVQNEYYFALDDYTRLDKQRIDNMPCDPSAEINDKYIEAVTKMPIAEERLINAERRLWEYEHRR